VGGGDANKIPSVGRVWIFSGATQYLSSTFFRDQNILIQEEDTVPEGFQEHATYLITEKETRCL